MERGNEAIASAINQYILFRHPDNYISVKYENEFLN